MSVAPLRGKRILLAEDDASARKVIAHVLIALGAEVVEIADGGRLLVAITAHYKDGRSPAEVDLIITDVRMPVVGGLDVFKGLRAAAWKTPVIVMTGYESAEVRDVVARFDATLLMKPLDLDELERIVHRLLVQP